MWIARNKDNSLRLFHNKPYKSSNEWKSKYEGESEFYLTEEDFPELKWESEPVEAEIVLAKKKNEVDSVGEYIEYLESLEDDFALELRSDVFYYIRDKVRDGVWKTFEDANLEEIKKFLVECISTDYDMIKAYFPKECKRKIDMKYIDKWFNFAKYELNGIDNEK